MKEVRCRYCGFTCYKYGKTRAGTQRWKCRECGNVFTLPINRDAKDFSMFLDWLFSKDTQKDMTGEGRNFRRKTAKFWDIWAMPPKIEAETTIRGSAIRLIRASQAKARSYLHKYHPNT